MDSEIRSYVDFIDALLTKTQKHIQGLSREAVNWQPQVPNTNSVAAIAVHMCGVVNWWLAQGVAGKDVGRDRDSEFRAVVDEQGAVIFWGKRVNLSTLIDQTKAKAQSTLTTVSLKSLDETITMPRMNPCTKRWAIVHTIDELAQHVGHIELTMQLWGARGKA